MYEIVAQPHTALAVPGDPPGQARWVEARSTQRDEPSASRPDIIDAEFTPAYDLQNQRLLFMLRQASASVDSELERSFCR